MHRTTPIGLVLACVLATSLCSAQRPRKQSQALTKKPSNTAFTLKNIFPPKERPLFGPRARGAAFCADGRYAAYLWRSYRERRHGSDLWVYDTKTQKTTRITSAVRLAKFQRSAREVVADRTKKAHKKKADKKATRKKIKRKAVNEEQLGNVVSDKDALDKSAPRYAGVASLAWAPKGHELIFSSGGDLYRLRIHDGAIVKSRIERLTCTAKAEGAVAYLPDGSGYTCLVDSALMLVRFGSHLVRQIDPRLPTGETMTGYRLSPNGKKLVFVARKGERAMRSGSRRVKIARYRQRFMEVREVPRHVSDDPIPPSKVLVYLQDLEDELQERSKPIVVYEREVSGPRDVLAVPYWSPDSKKVAFSVFEQKTGQVTLLQATFPPAKPHKDAVGKGAPKPAKARSKGPRKHPARVVYRWLHTGGPNTPRMMRPRYLPDSRHIAYLSEQTGFRHLHVLDPVYESQHAVTSGRYEVYPFHQSKDHRTLFVLATKEHATRQDLYAIDLVSSKMTRLSHAVGTYRSAAVSNDGKHALAIFTAFGKPRELVALETGQQRQVPLTISHPLATQTLTSRKPRFFSFVNRHGQEIHGFGFRPRHAPKTKRPLLIYVYGGPLGTRKQVAQGNYGSDAYLFNQYMTRKHGYITAVIDPRGMSGYGAVFEKANYEHVGRPQVEDLTDAVTYLVAKQGADPKRVGIYGWSFGGFQTQMCLYTAPDVFQVGIAGAGPTEWQNYNSWYSTGTIGPSRTGKTDLEKYSLLPLAKGLRGKLLLVHGMEDPNVLFQDTVRVYRELLKANKETLVELFLDPTGSHGLGGDVTRLRRARKYEEFLLRTLGDAASPKPSTRKATVRTGAADGGRREKLAASPRPSRKTGQ